MEKHIFFITADVSSRHSAFVLWRNDTPIDIEIFIDKDKIDYFDGCDLLIKIIKKLLDNNCLQIKDIDYIYIEKPIHFGPNQNTIILLSKFVYTFAYSVFKFFNKKPKFVSQAKIKKSVVGSQPRGIDKKAMVENKMVKKYRDIYNKLPNKRSKNKDLYSIKYKTSISDLSDALALGEHILKSGKF